MSDILDRLRAADVPLLKSGPFSDTRKTIQDAAAEIERLRDALKVIAEAVLDESEDFGPLTALARAALEQTPIKP